MEQNGLIELVQKKSKGTKVFALGGNVNNIGLVEVPMGTNFKRNRL